MYTIVISIVFLFHGLGTSVGIRYKTIKFHYHLDSDAGQSESMFAEISFVCVYVKPEPGGCAICCIPPITFLKNA